MKHTNNVDITFDEIVNTAAAQLRELGFKRKRISFQLVSDGNCGIIGFQRSTSNTKDRIRFTVNIDILCGEFLDACPSGLPKASASEAHVHLRIGFLLPEGYDKWWEITNTTSSVCLAQEVTGVIVAYAVPYITAHLSTGSIIALWESGQCPGLTDYQRVNYLAQLKANRGAIV